MKVQPHPTSPKYKNQSTNVSGVWKEATFQQPLRVPWWRMLFVNVVVSFLIAIGVVFGWGWLSRHAPLTRWLAYLPSPTTTTVVQTVPAPETNGTPDGVTRTVKTLLALSPDLGATGVYTLSTVTGTALPLSSNGWLLTIRTALPSGSSVALPVVGQPMSVSSQLTDPSTDLVFLKTAPLNETPITLADLSRVQSGQRVWVVAPNFRQGTILSRQLVGPITPRWLSSDRTSQYWQLDSLPETMPLGSAVLNNRGEVIGLLGAEGRVLTTDSVIPVLKGVVERGQLERPSLGVKYVSQFLAVVANQDNPVGALIGADAGDQAVVPKGAADKAGLRSGDIITALDGQPLTNDLRSVIENYTPGQRVHCSLLRQGKKVEVTIVLGSVSP